MITMIISAIVVALLWHFYLIYVLYFLKFTWWFHGSLGVVLMQTWITCLKAKSLAIWGHSSDFPLPCWMFIFCWSFNQYNDTWTAQLRFSSSFYVSRLFSTILDVSSTKDFLIKMLHFIHWLISILLEVLFIAVVME